MSVISVFAIISVVLLFIGFWVSLITDFDSYIGIIILFCGLILAGITYFAGIHNKEVINTETVEAESTKTETDNAVEELIDSFKGEDSVESQKDSEASEEAEGDNLLITIIAMLVIFSPVLLFMVSELIEDVINFISDLIEICFPKKNKETTTKEFVRETNENSEDNPFIKKIPTPKQKKGINIDKLAEKDSKIAYIVWAVKFLNDQGKESYTRKLKNYYIPEIMQAYEQYQKVKSFHVKEMTAEAKKHYEKIVDLSYKVANVEVKKAAGEIVMDMDCNADVCEDIYKRDGYSSMHVETVVLMQYCGK